MAICSSALYYGLFHVDSAEIGPLFHTRNGFRPLSCEKIYEFGSYFAHVHLLTIRSLGLSHDIFRKFLVGL